MNTRARVYSADFALLTMAARTLARRRTSDDERRQTNRPRPVAPTCKCRLLPLDADQSCGDKGGQRCGHARPRSGAGRSKRHKCCGQREISAQDPLTPFRAHPFSDWQSQRRRLHFIGNCNENASAWPLDLSLVTDRHSPAQSGNTASSHISFADPSTLGRSGRIPLAGFVPNLPVWHSPLSAFVLR